MKNLRFHISLYVIIPFIFSGLSLLSTIIAYQITTIRIARDMDPFYPVAFWGGVLFVLTAICGALVARMMLKPMEEFAQKTEALGVLENVADDDKNSLNKDDMHRYTQIFKHVTELLSQVESQKLFPDVVAKSRAMRGVLKQVIKVAPTDSTVLIFGETGTGKEVIANSIYERSKRYGKPFVAINCAAIPEGLLESELFGHEKGAFTGANARKLGKFEIANGGTLFLDEIGDMPLNTQAKVLRVLQDSKIERVGGNRSIKVDVRFIAATNKDLAKMVEAGDFRQDLFFRLNVFVIYLDPLRERKDDIPEFIDRFLKELGNDELVVAPSALKLMTSYAWPGNVRELRNAVESACVLAGDRHIEPRDLPPSVAVASSIAHPHNDDQRYAISNVALGSSADEVAEYTDDWTLDDHIKDFEKGIIVNTLTKTGGVQVKAAELLRLSTRSLGHRIKKYDIDVNAIKESIK